VSDTALADEVWTPWRAVYAFGLVSMFGDMVYEGMRSMSGPCSVRWVPRLSPSVS